MREADRARETEKVAAAASIMADEENERQRQRTNSKAQQQIQEEWDEVKAMNILANRAKSLHIREKQMTDKVGQRSVDDMLTIPRRSSDRRNRTRTSGWTT